MTATLLDDEPPASLGVEELTRAVERAMALGASAARGSYSRGWQRSVDFEAGRLKNAGNAATFTYWVNVVKDGRRAEVAGNRPERLLDAVERVIELAQTGSTAHFESYPPAAPAPSVRVHSARTRSVSRQQLIGDCQSMLSALKEPELWLSAWGGVGESEEALVTSAGLQHRLERTYWYLSGHAQRINEGDVVMHWRGRSHCEIDDYYDPSAIAGRLRQHLAWSREIVDAPSGELPLLLEPEALQALLWALVMGVDGRNVAKGDSPLKHRLGEQVLSSALTVYDDPHEPFAPSSQPRDWDGLPSARQTLVEDGVLLRFLYDLDSAGLVGVAPTGNAACAPYKLKVLPGSAPSSELIRGIRDGLYVTGHLIGFGQGNLINGDFSVNLGLAYRIRGGEIQGRVKNVMLTGNVYELLSQSVVLSSDTGDDGAYPFALVPGATVRKRT